MARLAKIPNTEETQANNTGINRNKICFIHVYTLKIEYYVLCIAARALTRLQAAAMTQFSPDHIGKDLHDTLAGVSC